MNGLPEAFFETYLAQSERPVMIRKRPGVEYGLLECVDRSGVPIAAEMRGIPEDQIGVYCPLGKLCMNRKMSVEAGADDYVAVEVDCSILSGEEVYPATQPSA